LFIRRFTNELQTSALTNVYMRLRTTIVHWLCPTKTAQSEIITCSINVHTNVSLYSRLGLFQQSLFLTIEFLLGHGWWAGSREWWPWAPVRQWESWITPRGAWHACSRSYGQVTCVSQQLLLILCH